MRYVTYRVRNGIGTPGAVVCRPHTDEETNAARNSPFVIPGGGPEVFETAGDPWPEAYRLLGVK